MLGVQEMRFRKRIGDVARRLADGHAEHLCDHHSTISLPVSISGSIRLQKDHGWEGLGSRVRPALFTNTLSGRPQADDIWSRVPQVSRGHA
jgi:hypothetical protein